MGCLGGLGPDLGFMGSALPQALPLAGGWEGEVRVGGEGRRRRVVGLRAFPSFPLPLPLPHHAPAHLLSAPSQNG